MNYDFTVEYHEEQDFYGLVAQFMPGAEPSYGLTAAHDIIEHFSGVELDSNGEALALGAMLYIRGISGYWENSRYDVGTIIYYDVARLFTESWKWGDISDPGNTTPLDEMVEEWLDEALALAKEEVYECMDIYPPDHWIEWTRGWLRKGFRKARKRYSLDPYTLKNIFKKMERELDIALEKADKMDVIRVSFVRKTGEMLIRIIHPWEKQHPEWEPGFWE